MNQPKDKRPQERARIASLFLEHIASSTAAGRRKRVRRIPNERVSTAIDLLLFLLFHSGRIGWRAGTTYTPGTATETASTATTTNSAAATMPPSINIKTATAAEGLTTITTSATATAPLSEDRGGQKVGAHTSPPWRPRSTTVVVGAPPSTPLGVEGRQDQLASQILLPPTAATPTRRQHQHQHLHLHRRPRPPVAVAAAGSTRVSGGQRGSS